MDQLIRVAIADDHNIVVSGYAEIIHDFGGFSVDITAHNGKELLDKIGGADIVPDIVVMDISMPVMDGYETLDAIKKKWPEIKVLILTMHKHEMGIIKMFRGGASGYLLKNCKPEELQKALHSIYNSGFYFSEIASVNLYHRLQHSVLMPTLTEKELQLLKQCHTNLTYQEIGKIMHISERSVAGYRTSLFEKLGVNSRAELVVCAMQMGLIRVE